MAKEQTFTFQGMDGRAGFRRNQQYTFTPEFDEEVVRVPMAHAPQHGSAPFSNQEWGEWWKLAK